jgi:hypothetical protein
LYGFIPDFLLSDPYLVHWIIVERGWAMVRNKEDKPNSDTEKDPSILQPNLSPQLDKFAAAIANGATKADAAQECGRKKGSAHYLYMRPGVQERISELQSLVREATNRGVVQEAVRAHREITIDRNDIIMGLVDEARTAKSDRARVSAWTVLADIFMLRAKNLREVYDFYGWTSDELKLYAETGESPARFQHFAGKGRSATESGTAGLRTNKAS